MNKIVIDPGLVAKHHGILDQHGFPTAPALRAWHRQYNKGASRKMAQQGKVFDALIVDAIQSTTIQERQDISDAFRTGEPLSIAALESGGINAMALLVASLVDAENPLVIEEGRLLFPSLLDCARFLLSRIVEYPVDNSPKSVDKPVDNLLITCGNPVDKHATYPQANDQKEEILSYPQSYPQAGMSYPQAGCG